jgi:hypothetical protein
MVVAAAVRYYTPPLPLLLLLLSALSRCFTVGIESLRALLLLLLNAHKSFSNRGKKRGREVCVTETDRSVRRVFPLQVFLSFFSSLLFFFFFFLSFFFFPFVRYFFFLFPDRRSRLPSTQRDFPFHVKPLAVPHADAEVAHRKAGSCYSLLSADFHLFWRSLTFGWQVKSSTKDGLDNTAGTNDSFKHYF